MTKDEIHLNNFTESLRLSQKMFNLGLLLSFFAVFVAFNPSDAAGQAKIPLLDIKIESKEGFLGITALFFMLVGIYMNFAIKRCFTILQLIENQGFSEAAKSYPSIINANFSYTVLMVATLSGAWAAAIVETFNIEAFYAFIISQVIITPYIYGARKSKNITPKIG